MKKICYILELFISFILIGCGNQNKIEHGELNSIIIDWDCKDLDYSNWVEDSVLIVPLETTDDCLIGKISNLIYLDHKIYIADIMSKAIYIFDEKGHLLTKLRACGAGPEEYIDITAFTIHDSHLFIYDNTKMKIFVYNENGDFLYQKDASKIWGMEMFCLDEDLYLFNDRSVSDMGYYSLYKLELTADGNLIEPLLPFDDPDGAGWGIDRYCCVNKNEALLTVWPYNTIYIVKDGKASPIYEIDYRGRQLPERYINENGYTAIQTAIRDNYVTGIETLDQTNRYLFMDCSDKDGKYIIIYDKDSGESVTTKRFYNRNLGGLGLYSLASTYMQDGYILSYCNLSTFISAKDLGCDWDEKEFASEHVRKTFKKLQQADIEDNPVIIIQKIKEDVELF